MKHLVDTIIDKLLNLTSRSSVDDLDFWELTQWDRWLLLNSFFEKIELRPIHFLHVPKTGGTTLGETLGADKKITVISVDARIGIFLKMLVNASRFGAERGVLTRAHHPFGLIKNSGCLSRIKLIFSGYRDPEKIHMSMINMIMRRLKSYYAGEELKHDVRIYCERWVNNIEKEFTYDENFALAVMKSEYYKREASGIYSKFFQDCTASDLDKICFLNSADFDEIFVKVFDYEQPPPRRNVSDERILNEGNYDVETMKSLVAEDDAIVKEIRRRLISPTELRCRLENAK